MKEKLEGLGMEFRREPRFEGKSRSGLGFKDWEERGRWGKEW